MNRGFPCYWPRFPRKRRGGWFCPDYMPDENLQSDDGWDDWGNCPADRPPPHWDQCHPEQQGAYDGNNYNFQGHGRGYDGHRYNFQGRGRPRGSFHGKRPYFHEKRGRPYRGSKRSFSKERGGFQKSSRSSCSIDSTQNKKERNSEKVAAESTASKETKQDKDSTASVNKTDPPKIAREPAEQEKYKNTSRIVGKVGLGANPETERDHRESCPTLAVAPSSSVTLEDLTPSKEEEEIELVQTEVQLKDSQASEDPPSQTAPAKAPTEEQTPSETTEHLPTVEKDEPVLVKLKVQQGSKDPPSQTVPMPSAGESTEEQIPSEITESLHSTEQEDSVLTQISSSCEDVHCHHACVAPATNSSSLSNIQCVPVLVRGEQKRLHLSLQDYSWESGWAPEDYLEPPWSVNQAGKCNEVSENDKGSVFSQSPPHTVVSCNLKCDTERLLEYRSCSPKSHHSSDSRHSSSNWAPRELHVWSSRSPHRHRSRSPHGHCSRSPPGHRSSSPPGHCSSSPPGHRSSSPPGHRLSSLPGHPSRSPPGHPSRSPPGHPSRSPRHPSRSPPGHPSRSPWHPSRSPPGHPSRSLPGPHSGSPHGHPSRSPCRWEYRSQSPLRREYSPQRQENSSRTHWGRRERSCSPSQENSWKRDSPSYYLAHKINHHDSPEERSKTSEVPLSYSPESPTLVCKMKTKSQKIKKKKITQPERSEKKRRTSPGTVTKSIKAVEEEGSPSSTSSPKNELSSLSSSSENTDSFHHPSAGEETSFSASSWTPYDHSAAVLARKEEIEQAYLQAVLNFAVVAAMLVDKEPCMEKAMESALRANLRRIGNYYEQLLKNYIDSLAEAGREET